MLLEILFGIQFAILIIFLSHRWHARKQLKLWSNSLVIAALIYIGFMCYNQAWSVGEQEALGVLVYGTLAILGYRYSSYFLALGWALHVLWDLVLHNPSTIAPQWYPGVCLGFDLVIAGYIGYLIWTRDSELKPQSAPNQ